MIRYEVQVRVRPDLADAFAGYMRQKHLPEILATGCFVGIRFERGEESAFRTCYEAASHGDLDRYLAEHTRHFREDFLAHFPEGCEVQRAVWKEVQHFIRDASDPR